MKIRRPLSGAANELPAENAVATVDTLWVDQALALAALFELNLTWSEIGNRHAN
jgi:hypothetical protein